MGMPQDLRHGPTLVQLAAVALLPSDAALTISTLVKRATKHK